MAGFRLVRTACGLLRIEKCREMLMLPNQGNRVHVLHGLGGYRSHSTNSDIDSGASLGCYLTNDEEFEKYEVWSYYFYASRGSFRISYLFRKLTSSRLYGAVDCILLKVTAPRKICS